MGMFRENDSILKNDLKLNIPDMLIERTHRTGPVIKDSVNGQRHRQIIVRFATWHHRTQV